MSLIPASAASIYGFHPVLIPYGISTKTLLQHLQEVQPDVLIAEAGTLEVNTVLSGCQSLTQVIWVTKSGNEHMDFAEAPKEVGGNVKVSTWHDLVEEHKSPSDSTVPSVEKGSPSPRLSIIEPSGNSFTAVEYTSEVSYPLQPYPLSLSNTAPQNIVAATAALINTLPRGQRLNSNDVVLPIAPLTSSYPLILIFASLFSHASVALNSVAGEAIDFALAASTISPTILLASSQSTLQYHNRLMKRHQGPLAQLSHYWQNKSLLNGNMPKTPLLAPPATGATPSPSCASSSSNTVPTMRILRACLPRSDRSEDPPRGQDVLRADRLRGRRCGLPDQSV